MLQGQIFIDMDELKDSRPLHDYIMHFLAEHDIVGATSFTGHTGFGKNHQIKRPTELFSFDEPPILITFIDEEKKVRSVISELRKEVTHAFIAVHPIEML
jgi:PII-like signaling protein